MQVKYIVGEIDTPHPQKNKKATLYKQNIPEYKFHASADNDAKTSTNNKYIQPAVLDKDYNDNDDNDMTMI